MRRSFRPKTFLLLLVIAAATLIVVVVSRCGGGSHVESALGDPSLIDGRVWVEKRPEKLTDYVHAAIFISRANFGLFERASAYDVRAEFFDMTRDKEKVKLTFPQTNRSNEFTFKVTECDELKPFDLCLDVSKNPWDGPKRYYGFSRPDEEDAALGPLAARLHAAASAH